MKHVIIGFFVILVAESGRLEAHAFLKDAHPAVGSTVQTPPNEVQIRFTEKIEPNLSRIQVFDASGKEVDKRDLHLDRSDHALLHISLPRLGAGTYKVVWRVVSADTHATSGSFTFRIVRDK
jgi:methionine-rich copper-binding protein CopC